LTLVNLGTEPSLAFEAVDRNPEEFSFKAPSEPDCLFGAGEQGLRKFSSENAERWDAHPYRPRSHDFFDVIATVKHKRLQLVSVERYLLAMSTRH
jgi:hypothetical protein